MAVSPANTFHPQFSIFNHFLPLNATIRPETPLSSAIARLEAGLERGLERCGNVERKESACKPGSVEDGHSSATRVATGLLRPTRKRRGRRHGFPIWPCIGWGLPCHATLPCARCALTAPFHPYRSASRLRRYVFCGTGRGLAPPRRYLAPCPAMPGLSSMPAGTATVRPTPCGAVCISSGVLSSAKSQRVSRSSPRVKFT